MHRPYVICHMVTSVDGKVTGNFYMTRHAKELRMPTTGSTGITRQMLTPAGGLPWRGALPAAGIPT